MKSSIAFGQYYPSDSLLHRLDPRMKIILAVLFIVCTFLCKNLFSFVLLFVAAIFLILVGKIPLRLVLKSLRAVIVLITFTAILNVFWTKGDQENLLFSWKFINIYTDGIFNAVFIVIRIFSLIVGTGMLLTYTTTPIALTDAIEDLLGPLKKIGVPVHEFAMMMTIALRFIPTLIEETDKIMTAQKARGADFTTGGLIDRAKALIPVLIPLFVSAFNRASDLATAMECRCYHGGEGRTRMTVRHLKASDFVFLVGTVLVGAAIIWLNILGFIYTMK